MYTHVGQADLIPGGRGVQSIRLKDCWGCFVATTEHPQRAEAIAVRTNVLNGTARIEWAPHTEGYVE